MPIYEYRCENGHTFEVFQSMSDDPVETCEECDAPVQRVLHPVAIHFKGSGFHNTDYKNKGNTGTGKDGDGDAGSSSSEKKSDSSEKKSDSGSGSESDKSKTKAAPDA